MHRVLLIPEVLLNIFCHLVPFGPSEEARERIDRDLTALARTCRAFKEPALDVLWSELNDPSPVILCLPDASRKRRWPQIARKTAPPPSARHSNNSNKGYTATVTRPLELTERETLRSYTRRVRSLRDFEGTLDWESVTETYMDLTPAEPLFPNLRSLHCELTEDNIPLFQLPFPSLIDIHFTLDVDPSIIRCPLQSLVKTSPNVKRLEILCEGWSPEDSEDDSEETEIISDGIRSWSNLQSVTCPQIPLDMDALVHLSRMPSLVQFTFAPSYTLLNSSAPSDSLSFPALKEIKLHAESLSTISRLLSWTRLQAVTHFTVIIDDCPSKQDLISFMASTHSIGMDQTIQEFNLNQAPGNPGFIGSHNSDAPLLEFDDLQSCTAFRHLRRMNLDLKWRVNLSDSDLSILGLTWAWHLEELLINANFGWNRPGITPNGFAVLLETCPSLTSIALAIDTRGYTHMPARQRREPFSPSSFKRPFRLNVVDSIIERGSVDAMATFFASIVPHFDFILTSSNEWSVVQDDDLDLYYERWEDVHSQANEVIKKRWLGILCGVLFPPSSFDPI